MQNKILVALSAFLLCIACSRDKSKNHTIVGTDSNMICFENIQKLNFKIVSGNVNSLVYPNIIKCNGTIVPSSDEIATVTLPIQGTIRKLYISSGDYINKGEEIAIIENSEFVIMQEEYLIAKSRYEYFKEDFKRQGELNLENATSMKVMQKAQNEFKTAEASYTSLKKRLEIIGISPDSVDTEKLRSTIVIYAPISGYIADLEVNTGTFCTREIALCKILGDRNLILKLQVNEDKIGFIKPDQEVEFSSINQSKMGCKAVITKIVSSEINEKNPTVYAQILTKDENLKLGNKVFASINAGNLTLHTLPTESVINYNNKTFFWINSTGNCFSLTEFKQGIISNDQVEIKETDIDLIQANIVIKGARNIFLNYKESDIKRK